jgi:hypothetical protein
MPTLVASAYLTDNEGEITKLESYVKHFSMGWRIYDDLKDWKRDLKVIDLNRSSTLIYAKNNLKSNLELNEEMVSRMFLSTDFVNKAYDTMLGFFELAKKDVSSLDSRYISRFLDEQKIFHSRRRDAILESCADFYDRLHEILIKNNRKHSPV